MGSTNNAIAYLDCFSGISGDMLLGACLHAGLPEDLLLSELESIKGLDFDLRVERENCSGISCKKVTVSSSSNQQFRHLENILELLDTSSLKPVIKERATRTFTRLAEAEAKVHNVDIRKIHFHEVGAVDTIVDIVGALIGLDHFGITKTICSPLPMGRGFVRCDHGNLPLPAPAVCALLHEAPTYGVDQEKELITPTGAALVMQLTESFGHMPAMTIKKVGYGAGSNTLKHDQPNLLRLIIGEQQHSKESQSVEIIECNLDDWNTEMFPYLSEQLFENGALDVSLSSLLMKKGRPGHRLQVIADPAHALALKQIVLSETTSIGLRFRQEQRITLSRKMVQVNTQWGKVEAKQVQTPEGVVLYPEYEVCKKIAQNNKIPLTQVYYAVIQAAPKDK